MLGTEGKKPAPAGVAVVVYSEIHLDQLLIGALRLADSRQEDLRVLLLSDTESRPDWFKIPDEIDESRFNIEILSSYQPGRAIVNWLKDHNPSITFTVFEPDKTNWRYIVNKDIDTVLHRIKCPTALIIPGEPGIENEGKPRVVVPYSFNANSQFALRTATQIHPSAEITVVAIGPEAQDESDRDARTAEFIESLGEFSSHPKVHHKLLLGEKEILSFNKEMKAYSAVVVGVSRGHPVSRALLGDRFVISLGESARRIVKDTTLPVVILRQYQGWFGATLARIMSGGGHLLPKVSAEERTEIYKEVRKAAQPRIDFFMMIGMSAAIASLGLLLGSPAVIIGAMLIAPLMSAIIGMGLAMVHGNMRFLLSSFKATLRGSLVATGVGTLIGFLNIDNSITSEMLGRSGPNVLDLGVAAISGAAAAYAMCRKNVSSSLPGIAIAVALVPPLASVGLFLSIAEWSHAYGALLLFLTNLAAISFTSGIVFTMVGFRPTKAGHDNPGRLAAFRRSFLIVGLLVLVVVTNLTYLTVDRRVGENYKNRVTDIVSRYFVNDFLREVRVIEVEVLKSSQGILDIVVTASSSEDIEQQEIENLADILSSDRGTPIRVSIINTQLVTALSGPD